MEQSAFIPTNQPQPQPYDQCDEVWIDARIALVMSAYRRDDYDNPDMFVEQVKTNLLRYPAEIVEYVTDPTTGIQARCKFPPSLAEIVAALEAEHIHQEKLARYAAIPKPVLGQPRERHDFATKGDGGPGTIYSNFDEAFKNHGRPTGMFEQTR